MAPVAAPVMPVFVTTPAQAAARDAAAIAAGVASRDLMTAAGQRAADALIRNAGERLRGGLAIYAGPGNNGGDAWVVAGLLRREGARVRVHAAGDPSTPDAQAAAATASASGQFQPPRGDEAVVVDGLLGTGTSGAPRAAIAVALERIAVARARGAMIVALDIPTGLDATTGVPHENAVRADLTVTFGTMKRGLLIGRQTAGAIEVADIGLGAHATHDDGAPELLDPFAVRASIPPIRADAHKGVRARVTIVGGGLGMAGAPILAAQAALRAGAGLVRVCVAPRSIAPAQAAVPEATAAMWPETRSECDAALGGADAVVIGPGLGGGTRDLVLSVLSASPSRVILDADALNAFAGVPGALRESLGGRAAVITPHVAECGRLLGLTVAEVLARRFDVGAALARETGAVVVLKGTPTVLSSPDGRIVVAPVGSPVLATGGSGDVLAGLIGTMMAVIDDPLVAAVAGTWAHGAAAERVGTTRVRGAVLADVDRKSVV